MGPQVPALQDAWPPDVFQLADMLRRTHWVLEQLAYDLPRGTATRGQLDQVVRALEALAPLLRAHDVKERNPVVSPPEQDHGEEDMSSH